MYQLKFNLQDEIGKIFVKKIPDDELIALVMEFNRKNRTSFFTPSVAVMNKWVVNYIRHNLTQYEYALWNASKDSTLKDYAEYKIEVLKKIGETYPKYQEEVELQIKKVKEDFNEMPADITLEKRFDIRRGDIWSARIPSMDGTDLLEERNVLVVSSDKMNKNANYFLGVVIEKSTERLIATEIQLRNMVVKCEQLHYIPQNRLIEYNGRLDSDELSCVNKGLFFALGIIS